ncbi:MAG TPA: hypothetical protein PLL20_13550 [Phycisphaerae bacterium]|nr:hypothetical protein [Phycisphaerae bacterium]HRR84851.1 hypothetical protein [Phycisphaerae bacterium]
MARRPDPQSEGRPADHDSSAHGLLGDVRRKLDQIERELTERERKLAEAESRLRDEQARLRKEQAAWSSQHGREMEAQAKLEQAAKLLAKQEALLKDREEQLRVFAAKNQELREQASRLGRDRDETRKRLAEAVEEAEIQSRRAAGLEKQIAVLKNTMETESAVPAQPTTFFAGTSQPDREAATIDKPGRSESSAALVAFGIIAVLVSAGLGVWSHATYKPLYTVNGHIKTRPGDAVTLSACADLAKADGLPIQEMDVPRGLLTFRLQTREPDQAAARMNQTARHMVALYRSPASAPASRPSSTPQRERIRQQIAEIEHRLEIATRPAFAEQEEGARLVAQWTAAEAQRREVEAALASLSNAETGAEIDPASVRIDARQIQAAVTEDRKLSSEIQALQQREAELSQALKRITDGSDGTFRTLERAIADGTARIDRAMKEEYGARIRESLSDLKQALAAWNEAATAMSSDWAAQRDALAGEADLLTCQTELDRAARQFIDAGSAVLIQFRQRLDAISQDTDEPTKGLVLGRALTKDLQPVVDAQQEIVRLARSATLTGNLDLATIVQQVAGLRRQVNDRRTEIEASLRAKMLDDLKQDREQTIRQRREQLTQRAEDLDREIRGHVENVRALVRRMDQRQAELAEWRRLQDERAAALRSLADVQEQEPPAGPAVEPVFIEFSGTGIDPGEPGDRRVVRSLLAGFGTLFVALVGWLSVHSYRSWHRGRQAIEACTRELRAATRE